jgi:hypothetical protein
MPTTKALFDDVKATPPLVEVVTSKSLDVPQASIGMSDKLFFIEFTPEGTLRRRWYLIQVDIPSTIEVNPDFASNHLYWCVFLAKHPTDISKSDEYSRWWPDWYKYDRCPSTDDIIYGQRVLIKPNTIPCSSIFIQWSTLLPLRGPDSIALVGPFTFEHVSAYNRVRQRVHNSNWELLIEACTLFRISHPTLGHGIPPSRHGIPHKKVRKKLKT